MGAGYTTVLWNANKKRYDLGILIFCVGFLILFSIIHIAFRPNVTIETMIIRAFGMLAITLLHIILVIGPLSRIDNRFLVLLYNRRHLGVTMFFVALIHGMYSILNFHTLGNIHPIMSLFSSNIHYDSFIRFPFEVLGAASLGILSLMAFTSHDFWLKNLGPKVWKALHMLVYLAYLLLIFHVVLGALQNEGSMMTSYMLGIGSMGIIGVHVFTGLKESRKDKVLPEGTENWIRVGFLSDIKNRRAITVNTFDERVAVFRNGRKVSAVSNFCRHQGGPIGEGKLVKGCITCPWHGYQYYPHNGCSPPPFDEKLNTFNLKLISTYTHCFRRAMM